MCCIMKKHLENVYREPDMVQLKRVLEFVPFIRSVKGESRLSCFTDHEWDDQSNV